ncbi:hypothetical protein F4820DRAFT_348699 [Hypoxylon rubiginosum]|uniref:Uncharacterized protein n=1 Tax=Hypoxylon rubiginosum TaxID=110542 RepID=A0ACB9YYI4_9PEZI|nr:hypothetical protein F4820DRAFT_348699 [Hypoxylon rubiginosum]
MTLLSRTLLGLSLATSVLGVPVQPSPEGVPSLCHEGTTKCNLETVYLCRDNKWVQHEQCDEPTWCKSDLSGNAWCASSLELKKRAAPVPSPTITTAPSTKTDGPLGSCSAGQTRCNGKKLHVCNDNGKWEGFQQCSECITDGVHNNCIPITTTSTTITLPKPIKLGDSRCHGKWKEIFDLGRWRPVEECARCVPIMDPQNGQVDCVPLTTDAAAAPTATPSVAQPTPSPSFSPAWDEPCFAGEVRCVGSDRIEACSAERNWEDFGPCPNCKQLYNTAVNCTFDDAGLSNFWTVGTVPTPTLKGDVGPAEECAQGFQRCARNNTTIETCNKGHWEVEGCADGQTCVGIHEGIAWCSVH